MSKQFEIEWKLACGHTAPLLEHEHDLVGRGYPERPRMCPVCEKPREVEGMNGTAVDPED